MGELLRKKVNQTRRTIRVRKTTKGNSDRPRMSVHVSNMHVAVQIIDDSQHKTLVSTTTVGKKNIGKTMTEKAAWVGADIAKKAMQAKVKAVVFDRGGNLYHGRVKALADAARKEGLEF